LQKRHNFKEPTNGSHPIPVDTEDLLKQRVYSTNLRWTLELITRCGGEPRDISKIEILKRDDLTPDS